VLGAGNGNDLDLQQLQPRFAEITLIDIDIEAVARMMARQPPEMRSALRSRAPVDLCCLETILNAPAEQEALVLAEAIARAIGGTDYDVVPRPAS